MTRRIGGAIARHDVSRGIRHTSGHPAGVGCVARAGWRRGDGRQPQVSRARDLHDPRLVDGHLSVRNTGSRMAWSTWRSWSGVGEESANGIVRRP